MIFGLVIGLIVGWSAQTVWDWLTREIPQDCYCNKRWRETNDGK